MSILVFGGTTEGRKLTELLSKNGMQVTLSVATEYGQRIIDKNENIKIITERLDEAEMTAHMKAGSYEYVIDATHPYAWVVTENIQAACQTAGVKYLRLVRPADNAAEVERGVIYVADTRAAADILNNNGEKVFLTIGSKELEPFTHINNFAERCYVRMIPMQESLQKAIDLGYKNANIICMQGPFDKQLNKAMLSMTGCTYMITKDSGDTGGFNNKLDAAIELGCKVIVIARPSNEEGYTYDELVSFFKLKEQHSRFFPLFIDMMKKKVLVVGGGAVAERRIKTLHGFGADITLISTNATNALVEMALNEEIRLIKKQFDKQDMFGMRGVFLVIAATNDRSVNRMVTELVQELNVLAIVSDCREECGCYFPAIAESGEYIAGLVSKSGNHTGVKELAARVRRLINDE